MAKKKIEESYDWHIGKDIHEFIVTSKIYTLKYCAEQMNIQKNSFWNKLQKPHFGNIYELIQISIILKKDFISRALSIIYENDVEVKGISSKDDLESAEEQIITLNEKVYRYESIIDKLTNS